VSERNRSYRHFAERANALLAAVLRLGQLQIGSTAICRHDGRARVRLVRRVFPGFDEIAPVIRELLVAPEGLLARVGRRPRNGAEWPSSSCARGARDLDAGERAAGSAGDESTPDPTAASWQTLR